jgi:excisionase family DNA binding protein
LGSHLGPEDIIGDFAADLIHRFKSGQYLYHDGRFQVWIGSVWSRWFFPGVKTDFYKDAKVTDAVNDRDFKDDQETGRKAGTLYRVDVDREQADRDTKAAAVIDNAAALADSIFRDLEDPSTVWGSVNEQTKQMLRDMRAGLTPTRNGRRLLKALRDKNPKAFVLGTVQGCGEDVEPPSDAIEGTCPPQCGRMPVFGEDGSGLILDIQACAENGLARMVEDHGSALTVVQLARILQCSKAQVYKLIEEKRLPALKIGTMTRLDPSTTADWIRNRMTMI